MYSEFILEYFIRPFKYRWFTMNKISLFLNLSLAISCYTVWYYTLVSYALAILNYFCVLHDYKSTKVKLTGIEKKIDDRNSKIRNVLSRW